MAALKANGLALNAVQMNFLLPADAKSALEAGSIDAWSAWGIYVAQGRLADHYRVVVDGSKGLLGGLGYLTALDTAIAGKRAALHDLVTRAAQASRWAVEHVDDYARYWSGLLGVSFDVARLSFTTAPTTAVPIDAGVIAAQQRTADLYVEAKLAPKKVDVASFFDASFNDALAS
ncbi:MAG: hypothetical protein JO001_28370 [Alphaproteobacteria bacterium]|nr:hypothetical protein [Alphaproteobacteria bacterium]